MEKLKIGLVGLCQRNFNVPLGMEIYDRSITFLKSLEAETENFFVVPIPLLISTFEEAFAAAGKLKSENIDFLLIQHTTLSSGELIFPFVEMGVPLGLWALPEPIPSGNLPLGSFIGMNLYSGILKRYFKNRIIRFKWFFGAPGEELFTNSLKISIKALGAIKYLREARIALVGHIAPGFYSLYFDPRDISTKFGTKVSVHEFCEIKEQVLSVGASRVSMIKKEMQKCGLSQDVDEEDFEKAAKLYLVLREMVEQNSYSGLAIECWPRFYQHLGFVPCSVVGFLNGKGVAVACEGDMWAVLSMVLLNYLSGERCSTLMDLVAFDNADESLLFWHCGPSAACWAGKGGLTYIPHCNIGEGVPWDSFKGASMVNDLVLKEGEVTIARITANGEKIFIASGYSLGEQKPSYIGSRGWVGEPSVGKERPKVIDFVNTVILHGVEHHFPIAIGNLVEELMEISNWLSLEVLQVVPYALHYQKL